jgi:hypothetical protein
MDHDYAQRRRVAFAIAITAIAAPAAFLLNRDAGVADDGAATTPPVGTVLAAGAAPVDGGQATEPASDPADTDPLGTAPVGFLAGSTLPEDDEPARIAIPRLPEAVKGSASFSSDIEETTRCHAKISNGVPFNATLTVTNLDNSRSIQCVASIGGPEPTTDVVLATATFAEIADLTDAPVPVQITWADA